MENGSTTLVGYKLTDIHVPNKNIEFQKGKIFEDLGSLSDYVENKIYMTSYLIETDFVNKFNDYKEKEQKVVENGTELDMDEMTKEAVELLSELKGYFNKHIRESISIVQDY
jgi:hypothetical protein